MISSMTGYGRGEATANRITAVAEVRTVNSRFLEVSAKLPRTMALRESDVRDLVRRALLRGKATVAITVTRENESEVPLRINAAAAKTYLKLLNKLRKTVKIREKVTLDHLLKFPEVLEVDGFERGDEQEWLLAERALSVALSEAVRMRQREGDELMKDLSERIRIIEGWLNEVEQAARQRVPQVQAKLHERVMELLTDRSVINEQRLELEVALMADRLDVTEECVRFRSHNKFFIDAMTRDDSAGRKLNFLVQEMNREANTIGAKAGSAEVAHLVVGIKEELEKIREQLQNIE